MGKFAFSQFYDYTFSKEEQNIANELEYYLLVGLTEKQTIATLCMKHYPLHEVEKLLPIVKSATDKALLQLKNVEPGSEEEEKRKKLEQIYEEIKPLQIFPELTQEEQTRKINEIRNKTNKAESIINYIPGANRAIKLIQERGEEGIAILTRAGEEFFYMFAPYTPNWSIIKIEELIAKELMIRRNIARTELELSCAKNGEQTEDEIHDCEYFIRIEKSEQRRISELITKSRENIDELIEKYYSSNYYQAQTILNESIYQDLENIYQEPKNTFNVQDFAILYFFAKTEIAPDEEANLNESQINNLKRTLKEINQYFLSHTTENKTQCEMFLNFMGNDILLPLPPGRQPTTSPGSAHVPKQKGSRFPVISQYDINGIINNNPEDIESGRFLASVLYSYYESQRLKGGIENGKIYIAEADFTNDLIGAFQKKTTALKRRENVKSLLDLGMHTTGLIGDTLYPLLLPYGYNIKTKTYTLISPYTEERSKAVWDNAIEGKRGKPIYPDIPFCCESILRENAYVQDLAYAIFSGMISQAKFKEYHHTPANLILKNCEGALKKAMEDPQKTSSEKTAILRRTYSRFYKILEEKTRFFEYFLPYEDEAGNKIKPFFYMNTTEGISPFIKNPTPTYKKWREQTIWIHHGGRNRKFVRMN